MYSTVNKNKKKTAFYKALSKVPKVIKEYVKQYTQGQLDLPDELVEAFTQTKGDLSKVEQICTNLMQSKEGAQVMKVIEQVYNAAQQQIDAEVNSSTGLFKDGGKVNYLRKLSRGSDVPENPDVFQSDSLYKQMVIDNNKKLLDQYRQTMADAHNSTVQYNQQLMTDWRNAEEQRMKRNTEILKKVETQNLLKKLQ